MNLSKQDRQSLKLLFNVYTNRLKGVQVWLSQCEDFLGEGNIQAAEKSVGEGKELIAQLIDSLSIDLIQKVKWDPPEDYQ